MRFTKAMVLPVLMGALLTGAVQQGKGRAGEDKGRDREYGHQAHEKGKGQSKAERAQARENKRERDEDRKPKADRSKAGKNQPQERHSAIRESGGDVARNRAGSLGLGKAKGRFHREIEERDAPEDVRRFMSSSKRSERIAGRIVALAHARGVPPRSVVIVQSGPLVQVKNRRGDVLFVVDDDRDLGSWRAVTLRDGEVAGAPSFCRSGAGHPVWGRQWCVDKGFGLGRNGVTWARIVDLDDDVVIRPRGETRVLSRDVLADILGAVVFNRLASHALSLGLVDPLSGRWVVETSGPRVLVVTSGNAPVAELVDADRDGDADVVLVALRPWQ